MRSEICFTIPYLRSSEEKKIPKSSRWFFVRWWSCFKSKFSFIQDYFVREICKSRFAYKTVEESKTRGENSCDEKWNLLYNLRSSEEKKISIPRFFVHKEVDPNPNFRFSYIGLLCQGNKYKSRSFAYKTVKESKTRGK